MPAGHLEQKPLPAEENVPAAHDEHAEVEAPPVEKLPAGQTPHSVVVVTASAAPEVHLARQYLPAGHDMHADSAVRPVKPLYLPAEHAVHVSVEAPPVE